MGGYPLDPMLRVRRLHEDACKRKIRDCEEQLALAKKARDASQQELTRYQAWRPEEEDRRFAAILGKAMDADALATFREGLALLAEGEITRQDDVDQKESLVAKEEDNLAKARQASILARKATLKLEEHREIWQTEQRKEAERLSDLEMEESRGPARENDESECEVQDEDGSIS
ncbi:MAG: YscO family type III secretion system apparatus protein [Desulfovibrio sp.]|nr:YscO family type III secretion system apparatus protein [Desulfovibrio sp.]